MKQEVRAVWLPFMEFAGILTGKSREDFSEAVSRAFEAAAAFGINRLFVHVRPFGDALYHSELFPSSHLVTGTEGDPLPFDPLEIMLDKAHGLGLALEAWLNPFRIRAPGIAKAGSGLCQRNPALHMKDPFGVITYRNGMTYNPASEEAQELLINGLREICARYPVDGIHFDDYFYPTADPYFDMESFRAYKLPGGGLSQAVWRRQNISLFLKSCYQAVHASGCSRFGLSPKGFMDCNLNEEFLDVPRLLSTSGYLDYVCPQAYFALSDEICPFDAVIKEYDGLIKADIQLLAGLAAYKLGRPDRHAGRAGNAEWLHGDKVLADMTVCARKAEHYAGYSLYNFQAAFRPEESVALRVIREMNALKALN